VRGGAAAADSDGGGDGPDSGSRSTANALKVLKAKGLNKADPLAQRDIMRVWDEGVQVEWQEFATYLEYMLYVESVAAWGPPTPEVITGGSAPRGDASMRVRVAFVWGCKPASQRP